MYIAYYFGGDGELITRQVVDTSNAVLALNAMRQAGFGECTLCIIREEATGGMITRAGVNLVTGYAEMTYNVRGFGTVLR